MQCSGERVWGRVSEWSVGKRPRQRAGATAPGRACLGEEPLGDREYTF